MAAADVGHQRARASSLSTTPSSAGSQAETRLAWYPGRKNRSQPIVHVGVVLVPADAVAAPGRLDHARRSRATVPSAIWKNPGRNAGLVSSVSATACSAGRVYRSVAGS